MTTGERKGRYQSTAQVYKAEPAPAGVDFIPPRQPSATELVIVENVLRISHLDALHAGQVLAVVIRDAYPKAWSEHLAGRLLADLRRATYLGAERVGRVGISLFETRDHPQLWSHYWAQTPVGFEQNRADSAPYPFPVDLLRLWADENWPKGALLARLEGRTCWTGLARVLTQAGEIEPHCDRVAADVPRSADAQRLHRPIAVNYHLQTGLSGGQLELWALRPTEEQVRALGNGYRLDRSKLPPVAVVITPQPGDLILHDASAVHAVRAIGGDQPRVTASAFIAVDDDGRLRFWS